MPLLPVLAGACKLRGGIVALLLEEIGMQGHDPKEAAHYARQRMSRQLFYTVDDLGNVAISRGQFDDSSRFDLSPREAVVLSAFLTSVVARLDRDLA